MHSFQKIVIFGPYKSGTTGLFYKIKNSLQHNTRYLFEATEYLAENADDDRNVLAKVILAVNGEQLGYRYNTFMNFHKKILLTRDPRDLIVSGTLFFLQQEPSIYNNKDRLDKLLALLRRKEQNPKSLSGKEILEQIIAESDNLTLADFIQWLNTQYQWLPEFEKSLHDYHRLRYEDFVDGNLSKLEEYLNLTLTGSASVDDIHSHVPRSINHGNWKNWFSGDEDIRFFQPFLQKYIQVYGYDEEWILNDNPIIDPSHCSNYVENVVQKRLYKQCQT